MTHWRKIRSAEEADLLELMSPTLSMPVMGSEGAGPSPGSPDPSMLSTQKHLLSRHFQGGLQQVRQYQMTDFLVQRRVGTALASISKSVESLILLLKLGNLGIKEIVLFMIQ